MKLKKIAQIDPQLIINWSNTKGEYMVSYIIQQRFKKLGKYYILWI